MSLTKPPVRRAAVHIGTKLLLVAAFLLLPIVAIGSVVFYNALSSQDTPPITQVRSCATASCAMATTPACCGSWQATTLTAETDALAADPWHPGRYLAGTGAGLQVSSNGGRSWQAESAWKAGAILSFAVTPSARAIFAGTADGIVYARSRNSASPWRRISTPLNGNPIFSLAYDPRSGIVLAGTVGALYRGEPYGTAWRWQRAAQTGDSSVTSIAWVAGKPGHAFASVFGSPPPVISTSDTGHTWQPDGQGLPYSLPSETLLPMSGDTADMILSTMGGGVWLHERSGTWRNVAEGLPEQHAMPLIAGANGSLFAGTMGSGVYAKQGPAPWYRLGKELSGAQYTVLSLAYVAGRQPQLLAGTALGVFRYPLGG